MRSGELNSYQDISAPNGYKTAADEARDEQADAIVERLVAQFPGDLVTAYLMCTVWFQGLSDLEALSIARKQLWSRMDDGNRQLAHAATVRHGEVLHGITEADLVIAASARAVWESHGRSARAARQNAPVMPEYAETVYGEGLAA